MGKGVIGLEFDSEVLVNKAPTLQLANGKTARFMTQYDTKTLLFTVDSEDMGQKVTGLAEGAIESMHNLPVSVAGTKLSNGMNGSEAAVHEVPEYTGPLGTSGEEPAPTVEKPEYTGPLGTAGEEAAPTVEKPEFTGGVNGTEPAVHEIAEYKGSDSLVTLTTKEDYTYKAPLAQQALPETGNKESDLLASLGLTAFFLGLFTLGKKREQ
ncbi:sialidase A precursor (neuraminidase A) [Streptococcus pneumoniae]|nr:sialidase A precursor (neuraminidase A) [Streptococcus pneumoniae]VJB38434.1 sialidase A precursor (neuraminidase A) [Streptococcus pneumoniae]